MRARIFFLCLMTAAASANAQTRAPGLVLISENDIYANMFGYKNQDRHYTQGIKLMYIGGDNDFSPVSSSLNRWTPRLGLRDEACNIGFGIGQNMYSPIDKAAYERIPDDQPYAGWLYAAFLFQRRGTTFNGVPTLDSLEFDLSVVGPAALARDTQIWWHNIIKSELPNGWHNQLRNEPGLELKYARYWRLTPNERVGRYFDFIPHVGCSLGNIRTDLNAGAFLRLGYNLPQNFGISLIDDTAPSIAPYKAEKNQRFSCYIFAGAQGRVLGHNIFLDGNSFRHGHNLDKENPVGDFIWGGGILLFQHVEASFTGVIRGRQFETQRGGDDAFGSITIKAIFAI